MIRRIVAVAAMACAPLYVSQTAPSATTATLFSEPIAHTVTTSSPQTAGPGGGALSWGLDRIDQRTIVTSSTSYNFSEDGGGVKAYILDSGVNASHPEFGGRVLDGWSYRSSLTALNSYKSALSAYASNPNTSNAIEPCANDGAHAVDPTTFDAPANVDATDFAKTDNDGHGTHVAGIIGGDTTGVAKNVSIIPVRALDSCGDGTTTMINEGLAWILANHQDGERAVLNLSIGFSSQVTSVDTAITVIMNEGVVVIAAAGNDALSACGSTPASTLGTVSVGASDRYDAETSFSNYGLCVDIFSPGSVVRSTYPYLSGTSNTYANLSGTSMAAPFVSGAVARFLQTLDTGPTNFSTGPTAAWDWLRGNVTTNAITYFNVFRNSQTPNRLLYIPTSLVRMQTPTARTTSTGVEVSWPTADQGTTYLVSTSPGSSTCTAVSTTSCVLVGLTSGMTYTISVVASNSSGKGAASTHFAPVIAPIAPTELTAKVTSKAVTLSWSAVTSSSTVTYVVSSSSGATVCTTTATTCTVAGLTNGTEYSFSVSSQTSAGNSPSSVKVSARPGFTVLKTTVAKKSKTSLSSLIRSVSTGKKTWTKTGACSIVGSRLVAPSRSTTCKVTLKVAKTSKYPAMSTKVTIAVK